MSKIFQKTLDGEYLYTDFGVRQGYDRLRLDLHIQDYELVTDIVNTFSSLYLNDNGHGISHILSVYNRSLDIWKSVIDMGVVGETLNESRERQNYERRCRMFMLAAMTHDLFSESHRETHHIEAYNFVKAIRDMLLPQSANEQLLRKSYVIDVIGRVHSLKTVTFLHSLKLCPYSVEDLTTVMFMVLGHRSSISTSDLKSLVPDDLFNVPYVPDYDMVRAFKAGDKDEPDLEILLNRLVTVTVHDKKSKYKLPIDESFKELNKNVFQGKDLLSKDDLIKIKYHLIDKFGRKGYAYKDMDVTDPYYLYHGKKLETMFDNIYFIEQMNLVPCDTGPDKDLETHLNSIYPYFKILFNHINMNYPTGFTESDLDLLLLSNSVGNSGIAKDGISQHVLKRVTSGGEDDVIVAKLYMDGKTTNMVSTVKFIRELFPNVLIVINSNNDLLVDFSIKPEAYLF